MFPVVVKKFYLLFPALKLFHQVVVSFGDLGQFRVHAALEVDEILPRFHCITRVLVALPNNLVQMSHRHLRHQWLLHCTTEHSLQSSIAALK